ncbi:class III poly(R)-hydroxyalkanoic acid synthase subunit PhaE [Thioflexithrix psekupsensis]|uniref:Poly(3-hydroxyalkanoate) polymerase subunit PhaE n=1 Tax=Thioflexithrix psekupsensis TaxID=1570016 RepID=A0A251X4Z7_9GAMM|nr:class III poly(R)-hydroxyalkanoic acid synthase subunit PhaE [Thioflexithrix psekupsensis]OUD12007.1 hypothetical protein TPSD3_12770 [Thioflexithrix psekupsensis]
MTTRSSDTDTDPNAETQENISPQDYWAACLALLQQGAKEHTTSSNASAHWSESLELWWQAVATSLTPDNYAVFRRFIDQGKSYFRLNSEFLKTFDQLQQANPDSPEWQSLWDQGFEELKASFIAARNEQSETVGFWEMPFDSWQRTLASLSILPNDLFSLLKDDIISNERQRLNQKWQQILSVPGLGYTREWQEQLQQGMRLSLAYQSAQQDYSGQFQKIGLRTLDLLRERILSMQKSQQSIGDLRTLYNIWIDCGEAAYAEQVTTPQFITIHARLINSLMAWKRHQQKMIDMALNSFHMPTRKELDTMNMRIHQLRRENKLLQNDPNCAHVVSLIQEVNSLRAEVGELRNHLLSERKKAKTETETEKKTQPPRQ